jgi:hypothetical protein
MGSSGDNITFTRIEGGKTWEKYNLSTLTNMHTRKQT